MSLTISETTMRLKKALRQYIEATYHIGHQLLIEQRRKLLDRNGVIAQAPYIESTPKYQSKMHLGDLELDSSVETFFKTLAERPENGSPLLYDPPYNHQTDALKGSLVDRKSLLVMTGTGSGKTECFLLPILGKLATEAIQNNESFAQPAMRAIVLYPMNALVNDQLARLRLMFGDDRVVKQFKAWSGRPARFARYTSRTLYPGVRASRKDGERLKSIKTFYIEQLQAAAGPESDEKQRAAKLVSSLKERGKWPAKPDIESWYGKPHTHWKKDGKFIRGVLQKDDSELITRHEVQTNPPDILVTNYSMLEYMMLRPIERPIFDKTRAWLTGHTDESFLLVVDEAHMYRGAAGAEVALLLRRLRKRLNIPPERLQVICTSASFTDHDKAIDFAAQLTGKSTDDFAPPVIGELALQEAAGVGDDVDAKKLASIELESFYEQKSKEGRLAILREFLTYRGVDGTDVEIEQLLFQALHEFPPMGELVNRTMKKACLVHELGDKLFPYVDKKIAEQAVTVLATLGSLARTDPQQPGLLPCRVHAFFRGLPGLWACLDSNCSELPQTLRGGPTGTLYAQPRDRCGCGSRVLEFFSCRNCGAAYARGYTDELMDPDYLWADPGAGTRTTEGTFEEFEPLDLFLENPSTNDTTDQVLYDYRTGQINPETENCGNQHKRDVFLSKTRSKPANNSETRPGQFRPCAVCEGQASFGRSSVQNHQTKGDQPFQALITEQIHVQPPNAEQSEFAPLQGRKVLVFSDSRQTAARLAPNLQTYSMQDIMRPLIVSGFDMLLASEKLKKRLSLEFLYPAVLIAAHELGIRLRPALRVTEPFTEMKDVHDGLRQGALKDDDKLYDLVQDVREANPPHSLLKAIVSPFKDRFYGLETLALASICEAPRQTDAVLELPVIPKYAESEEQKLALARLWIRAWRTTGFHLRDMPIDWLNDVYGTKTGNFDAIKRFLNDKNTQNIFKKSWLPRLLEIFAEPLGGKNSHQLRGGKLSLLVGGEWAYCDRCRETQRPYPGIIKCINCGSNSLKVINPNTNTVFNARKGYYRASTLAALNDAEQNPMALNAAEHTAQLNTAQTGEVFSKAEEYELLFQDIDIGTGNDDLGRTAIDILSCTTTMEVGIDIGALSGVALRNMPPARANYQQRAGRAGRRGTAIATVTAFGSADSHDEHYFQHPDLMIRGEVIDPTLNVDNPDIVRRHITAFLLQRYYTDQMPEITQDEQHHLFAVLGTVADFHKKSSDLSLPGFCEYLNDKKTFLRKELDDWLPDQLSVNVRDEILDTFVEHTFQQVANAIGFTDEDYNINDDGGDNINDDGGEDTAEEGEEKPTNNPGSQNLLDRLLFKGILPRYAFPTDVATFHVFNKVESTRFRPVFQFSPSQGLMTALNQYAPGKQVWIDNRLWTSGAIYSVIPQERLKAWGEHVFYLECSVCHYSTTMKTTQVEKNEVLKCPACATLDTLGPAQYWMRPPGFAHPIEVEEGTSPDDQPAPSYASRAKLTAPITSDMCWNNFNGRVRSHYLRNFLLVTNRGPKAKGYNYCTGCGRVEPSVAEPTILNAHPRPYPMKKDQSCPGGMTATGIVLGTEFITDVLLLSVSSPEPLSLKPGHLSTEIAMRTVSEALVSSACELLDLEYSELQADFRPSLSEDGQLGREAEIYLYDTLPGGAGFARQAESLRNKLLKHALEKVNGCPDNCDRSCYRCLRSYKNKFEHDLLDRHLGATLLHYMLYGGEPVVNLGRLDTLADRLHEDLLQHNPDDLEIRRRAKIAVPDIGDVEVPILVKLPSDSEIAIVICNGLTPGYLPTADLHKMKERLGMPIHTVDETSVIHHLPNATQNVLNFIKQN